MADAYKGLTIRIGGDTTTLQKALKNVDTALNSTQTEIRKVTSALKMDPGNLSLIATQTQLIGDKATMAWQKYEFLHEQLEKLKADNPGLEQLANSTANAAQQAADALQHYNQLNASLENVKKQINAIAGEDIFTDKSSEQIKQAIADLQSEHSEVTKLSESYYRLESQWHEASDALDLSKSIEQMKSLSNAETLAKASAEQLSAEFTTVKQRELEVASANEKVRSSISNIDAASTELKSELTSLDKALQLDPTNIDVAKMKMGNLKEQISLAEEKERVLNAAIAKMDASGVGAAASKITNINEKLAESESHYKDINQKLQDAKGNLDNLVNRQKTLGAQVSDNSKEYGTLVWQIQNAEDEVERLSKEQIAASSSTSTNKECAEYKQYQEQVKLVESEINALTAETVNAGKATGALSGIYSSAKSLGMTAYATITPIISMLGYGAVSAANDIDAAYRDMRKTVQGTDEDFEALRTSAMEFSNTHVTSTDQLLEIEAMGGQLGIATDNLESFAETVSNISIATDIGSDDAAKDLGQLSNILTDLTADKFPNFSDSLVRLGNNNAALESSIIDVTTRIGSEGSIVGMSTDQLLAWSTAVAATGQDSEAAGTAISKTMSDIETSVANGGDTLAGFTEVSGMTADDFAATWESDPSVALSNFVHGLKNVSDSGGSVDATLENLGITSVRQKQALEGLTQTTDTLDSSLQMSADAWNGVSDEWGQAGDAAIEADKKAEGFSGQLQILKNDAQNLGSMVGESLTPVLSVLSGLLEGLTSWFSGLSSEMQTAITVVALLTAGIGPVLTIFSSFGTAVNSVKEVVEKSGNAFNNLAKQEEKAGTKAAASAVEQETLGTATETSGKEAQVAGKSQKAYGTEVETAGKKAKTATTMSMGLKGALVGVGVAAAVMVASKLWEYYEECEEHSKKLDEATRGLEESQKDAYYAAKDNSDAMSEASESASGYQGSVKDLKDDFDDFIEQQAQAAESIKSTFASMYSSVESLSYYKTVIDSLNGQSNLSTTNQGRLKVAIDKVNEACGTSYTVIDAENGVIADQNGIIQTTTKSIDALITSKQNEIKISAFGDAEQQAIASKQAAYEELKKAQDAYDTSLKEYEETNAGYGLSEEALETAWAEGNQDLIKGLNEAQSSYDSSKLAAESYTQQVDVLTQSNSDGADTLADFMVAHEELMTDLADTGNLENFITQMENCGITTKDLSNLTPTEWQKILDSYNGDVSSISGLLEQYGISLQNAGSATSENTAGISETLGTWSADAQAKFIAAYGSADGFAQSLAAAGVSTEELNSLSSTQLAILQSNYDGTTASVLSILAGFKTGAGSAVDGAGANVATQASLGLNGLPTATTTATDSSLATLQKYPMEAYNAMTPTGRLVGAGIKSGTGEATTSSVTLMNDVNTAMKNSGDFSDVGKYIAYGVGGGIDEYTWFVNERARVMMREAKNSAKDEAQIQSPSRLFSKEVGAYIPQGVAMGMENNQKYVEDASRNMIDGALDATSDAQKIISSGAITDLGQYASNIAVNTELQRKSEVIMLNQSISKEDVKDAIDEADTGGDEPSINIGTITLDVNDIKDLDTVEEFVNMLKKTKAMA